VVAAPLGLGDNLFKKEAGYAFTQVGSRRFSFFRSVSQKEVLGGDLSFFRSVSQKEVLGGDLDRQIEVSFLIVRNAFRACFLLVRWSGFPQEGCAL
jgi:hypothetical protein